VRLLVPGEHIDKAFVRKAGRGTYEQLLECGVRIWEFSPTMLHCKTLTIDRRWTSIGSVNFDNRSFQLQDEATLCVSAESFTNALDAQFERDLARSEEIDLDRWRDRSLRAKANERLLTLARREHCWPAPRRAGSGPPQRQTAYAVPVTVSPFLPGAERTQVDLWPTYGRSAAARARSPVMPSVLRRLSSGQRKYSAAPALVTPRVFVTFWPTST
jgi:hypothetical protein